MWVAKLRAELHHAEESFFFDIINTLCRIHLSGQQWIDYEINRRNDSHLSSRNINSILINTKCKLIIKIKSILSPMQLKLVNIQRKKVLNRFILSSNSNSVDVLPTPSRWCYYDFWR